MKPKTHLDDGVDSQTKTDPLRLLSEKELSQATGFSVRTLQSWRGRGGGPPFIRVSPRCIRYRRSEVEAWLEERARRSTSDRGDWR